MATKYKFKNMKKQQNRAAKTKQALAQQKKRYYLIVEAEQPRPRRYEGE